MVSSRQIYISKGLKPPLLLSLVDFSTYSTPTRVATGDIYIYPVHIYIPATPYLLSSNTSAQNLNICFITVPYDHTADLYQKLIHVCKLYKSLYSSNILSTSYDSVAKMPNFPSARNVLKSCSLPWMPMVF